MPPDSTPRGLAGDHSKLAFVAAPRRATRVQPTTGQASGAPERTARKQAAALVGLCPAAVVCLGSAVCPVDAGGRRRDRLFYSGLRDHRSLPRPRSLGCARSASLRSVDCADSRCRRCLLSGGALRRTAHLAYRRLRPGRPSRCCHERELRMVACGPARRAVWRHRPSPPRPGANHRSSGQPYDSDRSRSNPLAKAQAERIDLDPLGCPASRSPPRPSVGSGRIK